MSVTTAVSVKPRAAMTIFFNSLQKLFNLRFFQKRDKSEILIGYATGKSD